MLSTYVSICTDLLYILFSTTLNAIKSRTSKNGTCRAWVCLPAEWERRYHLERTHCPLPNQEALRFLLMPIADRLHRGKKSMFMVNYSWPLQDTQKIKTQWILLICKKLHTCVHMHMFRVTTHHCWVQLEMHLEKNTSGFLWPYNLCTKLDYHFIFYCNPQIISDRLARWYNDISHFSYQKFGRMQNI